MIKILRKGIISGIILMLITVGFTVLSMNTSLGASEDEIIDSITKGVEWLASQQNEDGSWGINNEIACTGLVLTKLQEYAREQGKSPFEDNYLYKDNVIDGWKYIFNTSNASEPLNLVKHSLSKQIHGFSLDDPDARPNGYGIYFGSSSISYNTGICLMALEASGTPDRANDGGIDFDGDQSADTFFEIAQDTVDWVAYAQGDDYNSEGGWGYSFINNTNSSVDNSNSGYIVLGLAAAEEFGCTVPGWVRTKLNVWINNIQDPVDGDANGNDGGSYYSPGSIDTNELRTGNLIFEMTFYGDKPTDTRFEAAMDYIKRHWEDNNTNPGWGIGQNPSEYQAMFCLMKGLEYSGIDYIDLDSIGFPEHDWYDKFATVLIAQQNVDGSWPQCSHSDNELILSTTWALLTLEKVIPTEPPEPIPNPPVAEAGGPYIANEGFPITFDASRSYDIDGDDLEYRWDFEGDGNWDTETDWSDDPKATHIFGDDWVGMAILEVRKKNSNETNNVRDTALVTVKNVAPTVHTLSNVTINKNETVTLVANATDPGSDDLTFEWVWGYAGVSNDYTIYLNNPPNPDPYPSLEVNPRIINDKASCKFSDSGMYKVIVIVTDDEGLIGISNISITVNELPIKPPPPDKPPPNMPPIASLEANPTSGIAPLNVSFTGSGYDIDGTIVLFFWDFGDGTITAKIISPPLNLSYHYPTHTFMSPGIYYVNLTVMDNDDATDTEIVAIQVKEKPITPEKMCTISGYVYESNTTLKLANVNVSTNGVIILTNHSGFYSITLPSGIYVINISKSGYESISTTIEVTSNITKDFYLNPLKEENTKEENIKEVWEKREYFWILIIIIIIIGIIISTLVITRKKRLKQELLSQKPVSIKPVLSPTTEITPGIGPSIPVTPKLPSTIKSGGSGVPQQPTVVPSPKPLLVSIPTTAQQNVNKPTPQIGQVPQPSLMQVKTPTIEPSKTIPRPTVASPAKILPVPNQSNINTLPLAKNI